MHDEQIAIHATLPNASVALQLAQFCKRSTFDSFYSLTEAHLSHQERSELAYQMIEGVTAVARGLADAGFSPR
jgi:hypothetical protein